MKIYSNTPIVNKKSNCEKKDAELLILGANPVDLSEFPNVRHIYRAGVGSDNLPIEQIIKRKINLEFPSRETRHTLSGAVAKMAVTYIMGSFVADRSIHEWYKNVRNGNPKILIDGTGHIGSMVRNMCKLLELDVTGYDAKELDGEPVVGSYDVISFHVPLICYEHGSVFRDNNNLICPSFLARCKKDATLVNTSRGKIADEEAISEWLTNNKRARYFADTYKNEPYTEKNPLHKHLGKQFFGSPHTASYTKEVSSDMTADVERLIGSLK